MTLNFVTVYLYNWNFFAYRALKKSLIEQEMIDDYDPALMFTIPRLAIVW